MIVLALDPGVTTGWAVLGHDGAILESGNWIPEDVGSGIDGILKQRTRQGHEVIVGVETFPLFPAGTLAMTLRAVVATIESVLTRYRIIPERVSPGVWKTSSIEESPRFFGDKKLTPHERDAIRLGRFVIRWRLRE